MIRLRLIVAAGFAALAAAALWWRKHPSACPYGQRFWVEAPHPFITRERLRSALAPRPGETAPRRGDARALPYADATFDAAYLVTVLGEVPDQDAALRELRRVLKPNGRVIVGELFGDPHMVGEASLRRRATAAGLRFERRVGPRVGYFAVLRRAPS